MQYHWLNKQNNDRLVIFFAGWSFDYKPFEFLACEDFDVLMLYDYSIYPCPLSEGEFANLCDGYKKTYLVAWSMGVFVAYQLRNELPKFTKKIAINGTLLPVDDEYGIPLKPFILTLRHARKGLEGKFYQNVFDNSEEFERYLQTPVERSIENREDELKSLYDKIKLAPKNYEDFYDKAFVSENDKIIPPKNQLNFWKDKAEKLASGHFPFFNFKSWNEIICK